MPINIGYQKFKNQRGIALVETIAALGLAVVVITSLVSLSVFTLRASNKGKLILQASKISSDQLELVRAYRDANTWDTFVNAVDNCSGSTYCYMEITTQVDPPALTVGSSGEPAYALDSSGTSTENTPLHTEYWFTTSDPINNDSVSVTDEVLEIKVTVRWRVGATFQETNIYTNVSNWRN